MPKTRQDTYTPADPATAQCPHCGTTVPGAAVASPAVYSTMMILHCPACGGAWSEVRRVGELHRIWEPPPV